jgi:amidase
MSRSRPFFVTVPHLLINSYVFALERSNYYVNRCNEIFFDLALDITQELDAYYAKYGKTVGPLHGLPISLKVTLSIGYVDYQDQFRVNGVETSMGYVAWLGEKAIRESVFRS